MLNKEPTVLINGLSGLLTQVLPLLVVVGIVNISPTKLAALISIIGLVLSYVSTTLLRSQVAPAQDVITALAMPSGSTEVQLKAEIAKQN